MMSYAYNIMAYFVFCSKMESGCLCYYCNEKFDLFKDIFNHLIEKHNAETFKIKKLKFCEFYSSTMEALNFLNPRSYYELYEKG